jgi:hypothetical protein
MPNPSEQRRLTRVLFQARGMLSTFPGKYDCEVLDLSLKGALVSLESHWQGKLGDPCTLLVKLGEGGEHILMSGEIAHAENGRIGIKCVEIDLESITALRRLVEFNLGSESLLNRELIALLELNDERLKG